MSGINQKIERHSKLQTLRKMEEDPFYNVF